VTPNSFGGFPETATNSTSWPPDLASRIHGLLNQGIRITAASVVNQEFSICSDGWKMTGERVRIDCADKTRFVISPFLAKSLTLMLHKWSLEFPLATNTVGP